MATQTHKTNVEIKHSRESEIPIAIQTLQRKIDEQFPGQFLPRKKSVVRRTCNTELLLSHKAALNNVSQHVNSASHQQKAKKFGKASDKRYFLVLHEERGIRGD